MDRITRWVLISLILPVISYNCGDNKTEERIKTDKPILSDTNQVALQFNFDINRVVYQKTNYGDPPQLAIWIENPDSGIRTVWVSRRTAYQEWKGKIECPISLPFWESKAVLKSENSSTREIRDSRIDAVSGATPTQGQLSASILIPKNSRWNYYIEVNVSADYNNTYTYWSNEGLPDSEANGQPSIVYCGQIVADGKSYSVPVLLGRTEQRHAVGELIEDLEGISTAKQLIENIQVKSLFTLNSQH